MKIMIPEDGMPSIPRNFWEGFGGSGGNRENRYAVPISAGLAIF